MTKVQNIELKHPVTVDGQEITSLSMRRPKVRDMVIADKQGKDSNAAKEIAMFANLCEVDKDVIENLDLADYGQLQQVYAGFLS